MSKPPATDALSALVMMQQATERDMVQVALSTYMKPRWYCVNHLEELQHRFTHRFDEKQYPPEVICRLIARDNLVDGMRTTKYKLYQLVPMTERNFHLCAHCRWEAKHK